MRSTHLRVKDNEGEERALCNQVTPHKLTDDKEKVDCSNCHRMLAGDHTPKKQYSKCRHCRTTITSKKSKDRGFCSACDQDVVIDEPDHRPGWKKCIRGHEAKTNRSFCRAEVPEDLAGYQSDDGKNYCGQEMKKL